MASGATTGIIDINSAGTAKPKYKFRRNLEACINAKLFDESASLMIPEQIAQIRSVSRMFAIFFSSRRRHTRWNCDWSSDVCSSDLLSLPHEPADAADNRLREWETHFKPATPDARFLLGECVHATITADRYHIAHDTAVSNQDRKSVV